MSWRPHPPLRFRNRLLPADIRSETQRLALITSRTFGIYGELGPDGRELSAQERRKVNSQLRVIALCLRELDRDMILRVAATRGIDFRPTVSVLRIMQRNLVLASSDDPARRKRVMSSDTVWSYLRPVYELWVKLYGLPEDLGSLADFAEDRRRRAAR